MSTTRETGWWLPEPRDRFGADNGDERTRRFRWIGVQVIRLWLLMCAGFSGLLFSSHDSAWQALFGTFVFIGGTGMVLVLILSLAWFVE